MVREGFNVANLLRKAGYVAELNLGTQQSADFRWTLEIKPPLFVLTDQVRRKSFEVQTATEVLAMLEAAGADKTSFT
jgi:hypothetical protein